MGFGLPRTGRQRDCGDAHPESHSLPALHPAAVGGHRWLGGDEMRRMLQAGKSAILGLVLCAVALGQSETSGTVLGTVLDPSNAVVAGATVTLRNPTAGFSQSVSTDSAGVFRFNAVPQNRYQIEVAAGGFKPAQQAIDVSSSVPVVVTITVEMTAAHTSVEVTASAALIDTAPGSHTNVDASAFLKLPEVDPAVGLSSIINYSTGGTSSDANGFFHPLGDHAQTSFVVYGQPISDQQSKIFSTQLPPNAVQSMDIITGAPDAQYGDKSSLVVNATTKSGLGARPFGSLEAGWGSFGTWGENAAFGFGSATWGNFIAIDGIRTGRFLDSPEFLPLHDIGNNETVFDRLDYQPGRDSFHLNLFAVRNWFQVPNSYDQLSQDQVQRVLTWNIAPGFQHLFGTATLLTANLFIRKDQVNYYSSRNPLNDTPATESQNRFLMNWGGRPMYRACKAITTSSSAREFSKPGCWTTSRWVLRILCSTQFVWIQTITLRPCRESPAPASAARRTPPIMRTRTSCRGWSHTI